MTQVVTPTAAEERQLVLGAFDRASDGTFVISASQDETVRIWDRRSAKAVALLSLLGAPKSLAVHPWEPLFVCGDWFGEVSLMEAVGLEYGPIIVTAIERDDGRTLLCPRCWRSHALDEAWLGRVIDCPTPTCDLRLRVNPFVSRRPHLLGRGRR
jgi:hypothetical protein